MEESTGEDELNWRDFLNPDHYNVPLHALRYTACWRLALHLDNQDICMHNDIMPNFGGLAELVGFDGLEISNMERAASPTKQLLDDWRRRKDLKPTVGRLMEFLAKLGREDALTDCHGLIREDVRVFLDKPQQFDRMNSAPIQDETVSQGPGFDEIPDYITRQDVMRGSQTNYDAFICYNPIGDSSGDLYFIKQLIARFEHPPYNFKLFVPYRDELAGLNAHTITAKIISERCRHMIVVLSQNFLASPACEFQSTFAHSLSPGARNKRIVPIKIQDCPIPNILRIMACCDFTKKDLWDWSWDRLAKSIMIQLRSEDFQVSGSSNLEGLIRSTSFDLNSVLESGISDMSSSATSSRSTSPASIPRHVTHPIMTRPSETHQRNRVEGNTFPLTSKKPSSASSSGPFSKLFSNKKPKTKGNTDITNC